MSIGKKTGGRNFKKGQSGNPKGRTPIPPEAREALKIQRVLTKERINEVFDRLTSMDFKEFVQLLDPKTGANPNVLDAMVAGQIKAIIDGNSTPLALMLDRKIGPVKQKVELSGTMSMRLEDMTPEEKLRRIEEIRARRK